MLELFRQGVNPVRFLNIFDKVRIGAAHAELLSLSVSSRATGERALALHVLSLLAVGALCSIVLGPHVVTPTRLCVAECAGWQAADADLSAGNEGTGG